MKKLLFIIASMCCVNPSIYAHALWIETPTSGTKNTTHEVKIYYGEYAHGIIESTGDWYSDVKDLELWLIAPNMEKAKVPCASHEKYLSAVFKPTMRGTYTLFVSHSAKDLGGDYVYQFNTTAQVYVGKPENTASAISPNPISIVLDKNNENIKGATMKGNVYIQGKPAPTNTTVEIASPEGWHKEVKTDAGGNFEFRAIWEGTYLIEVSYTEDTNGKHYEKEYEHIWRCATVMLKIQK